jgi:thioredoxin 2
MANLVLDDRGVILTCPSCGQKNRLRFDRFSDRVRCPACKTDLPSPSVPLEVTSSADFDRLVGSASVPVLVDYWAPWCGPCRMVAPEVAKVAGRHAGRAIVVKVNTDILQDLGERFGIRSIPTIAVFVGGREVGRLPGARPAADIEAFLEQSARGVHK